MPPHIKKAHQRCSCLLQMHKNEPTDVVVYPVHASYWLWKKYFSSKVKWGLLNRPRIIKITMIQEVMTNKDHFTIILRYWLQNQRSQMIKVRVGPLKTTVTTSNQPCWGHFLCSTLASLLSDRVLLACHTYSSALHRERDRGKARGVTHPEVSDDEGQHVASLSIVLSSCKPPESR